MNSNDLISKDDDEVSIPRAALNKYVKDIVPHARLTNDTRELLLTFCHQFIHNLATNSSVACTKANKKTINPEHVLEGLSLMGLHHYVEETRAANEEAKSELKDRRLLRANYKFKPKDSEELEELVKQQQLLFEQARASYLDDQALRNELTMAEQATNRELMNASDSNKGIQNCLPGSAQLLASSTSFPPSTSDYGNPAGQIPTEEDDDYYD